MALDLGAAVAVFLNDSLLSLACARCLQDIEEAALLFAIPTLLILHQNVNAEPYPELKHHPPAVQLAATLLRERHNPRSLWQPYIMVGLGAHSSTQ